MRALYIEVLAIRDGPEPCVGCPRGRRRSVGRGTRRLGYRAAKSVFQGADAVEPGGRQHRRRRYRESSAGSARSVSLCMRGVSGCENREVPRLPVVVMAGRVAQGRPRPYA
jgi:hypothetical protein